MKKLFAAILSLLMLCGLATTAIAFEKGVDYLVCEEIYPDTYDAFGDTYPLSTAEGWPECTTGSLLKGTIITGFLDETTCATWNYAYQAFDGNADTMFEQFEMSPRSFAGLILDQAYELTEVRIKPSADRPTDRFHGLTIQGSNDGETWQTIVYFRQDAMSQDFHIFTPQPVTDQAYIDAGYGARQDNSFFWIGNGESYTMYRVTNPCCGLTIAFSEIEFYGVPKEATVLDARGLADRIPSLYYYPNNIVIRNAEPVSVDGNLTGTIVGGGWIWNRQIYENAFDNNKKTAYDTDYFNYECWVGMMFDEPYALTSVKVLPKKGQPGQLLNVHIQGSLDGVNWRTLAIYTEEDIPEGQEYATKEITDPNGYYYFRYICADAGVGANSTKAAELLFYGEPAEAAEPFTIEPTPIANLDTFEGQIYDLGIQNVSINGSLVGNAIRAGGRFLNRSSDTWELAFDGNPATYFGPAETNTYGMESWVGIRLAEPTVVTYVAYLPRENGLDKVACVRIQGSEDGVHWNTIGEYGFEDIPTESQLVLKPVTDTTAYTYFRIIGNQMCRLDVPEFGIYNCEEAPSVVVTAAPETSAPETAAPETAAPETAAPETAAPETAAPETDAPTTVEKDRNHSVIGLIAAIGAVMLVVVGIVIVAKKKK